MYTYCIIENQRETNRNWEKKVPPVFYVWKRFLMCFMCVCVSTLWNTSFDIDIEICDFKYWVNFQLCHKLSPFFFNVLQWKKNRKWKQSEESPIHDRKVLHRLKHQNDVIYLKSVFWCLTLLVWMWDVANL